MRSFCLTLVDSARATSKPRPEAASAPASAAPTLRNSRRVTVGKLVPPNELNLRQAGSYVKFSTGRHEQVAPVIRLGIPQEVEQARVPGHDDAGGPSALVVPKGGRPGLSVGGHGDLDPGLAVRCADNGPAAAQRAQRTRLRSGRAEPDPLGRGGDRAQDGPLLWAVPVQPYHLRPRCLERSNVGQEVAGIFDAAGHRHADLDHAINLASRDFDLRKVLDR